MTGLLTLLVNRNAGRFDRSKAVRLTRRAGRSRNLVILVVLFALVASVWRTYRHIIPSGTAFYPYWAWLDPIVEGPKLVCPDDNSVIQVQFCDAGGAQSGNYWTWLIIDEWLTGKHVIAEGYSDSYVRRGEATFPVRWLGGRMLSVDLATKRYGKDMKQIDVRLP